MKGNPTMLIWLGKIILGQKDKIETEGKSELTIIRKIVELGEKKDASTPLSNQEKENPKNTTKPQRCEEDE